jgi:hypothetical protein
MYMTSFLNVQNFLRNYQDLYLTLQLLEEGCDMSRSHTQLSKMFYFECAKVPATVFEFVFYNITKGEVSQGRDGHHIVRHSWAYLRVL